MALYPPVDCKYTQGPQEHLHHTYKPRLIYFVCLDSWGSLLAIDGDEAKPPSPPRKSKWTCTLCHTSMLSNDITAHTTGRRHMAALAKAGNAQSVPTAATTEAEANSPIPPGMLPWTCTLCLTTMFSKDAAGHRNGKRHITALAKAGNAQSGPTAASTEAEPNPLIPPHKSKWTCTLCLISMMSNDATAHTKGKRHMTAVAKAGNAQSVTEAEANPPITSGKSPWTCTVCLTTMLSNDVTAHKNGKRHIAALVKAGNAQSGLMTATTSAEANPPSPPNKPNWTCTICQITMSLNDSTTHEKGKRHIKALAKTGNVQSGPMATPSLQPNFPNPEPSAPFSAFAIRGTKTSTTSKSLPKAQKKKAHTTANSGQGIFPPSVPAYADDWQRDEERYEYLYHSSSCNAYIDNLDYSMCDSDCGWCGECNDYAYVSKSYFTCLVYLVFKP